LDPSTWILTGNVNFWGFTATAAHIHGPGLPGVNSPVIFPLLTTTATTIPSFTSSPLTLQEVMALHNGEYYVNIHSTAYPNGEIRGQLYMANYAGSVSTNYSQTCTTGAYNGFGSSYSTCISFSSSYTFTMNIGLYTSSGCSGSADGAVKLSGVYSSAALNNLAPTFLGYDRGLFHFTSMAGAGNPDWATAMNANCNCGSPSLTWSNTAQTCTSGFCQMDLFDNVMLGASSIVVLSQSNNVSNWFSGSTATPSMTWNVMSSTCMDLTTATYTASSTSSSSTGSSGANSHFTVSFAVFFVTFICLLVVL